MRWKEKGKRKSNTDISTFIWGLEKEHLRINDKGELSETPHPKTLQTPEFTRDFSESQLEIVTAPHPNIKEVISEMSKLTEKAASFIGSESLWPFSMPPILPQIQKIPIADFIRNPEPGMTLEEQHNKTVYRRGLALRYGKEKQTISGVHINFSLHHQFLFNLYKENGKTFTSQSDFSNNFYTALSSFLYSKLWLLLLFSAASPVQELFGSVPNSISSANSLRNAPSGYAGSHYKDYLNLSSYNKYREGIRKGTNTISEVYHFMGLVTQGKRNQLNSNVFQNSSEFYAPIKMKTNGKERDVNRIELRFIDINPYVKSGVSADMLRLIRMICLSWIQSDDFHLWSADPFSYMKAKNKKINAHLERMEELSLLNIHNKRFETILKEAAGELEFLRNTAAELDGIERESNYKGTLNTYFHQTNAPKTLLFSIIKADFNSAGQTWTNFGLNYLKQSRKNRSTVYELSNTGL